MNTKKPAGQKLAATKKGRISAWPTLEVALAAFFLALPALYNGFPILYPDSMTYLDDGRIVARAVFLHRMSDYYGMRSFFYSLVILPFHWNLTAWPIVALQCLLVAYVIRLVVRALAPDSGAWFYLAMVLLLSLFTTAGWFSSLILPDILGSILYLAIFLLAFAAETLSRAERWSLYLIAWWGITSHATHLVLSTALCLLLVAIMAMQRRPWLRILKITGEIAAIIAVAAASQLALHGYLYGHPSLNGERPPFLMARVIADGPGRWYLEKHCGELNWAICSYVQHLNVDPDHFLWSPDGIWQTASDDQQEQMSHEEMPLVLATLRAYPGAQFQRSAANFWQQLTTFGFDDLGPSSWVLDEFPSVMPASRASYLRGKQAQDAIPLDELTEFQFWVVIGSVGFMAALAPMMLRFRRARLGSLTAVIAFVVICNAAVTGVLSMPEDRLEARVIWMVPFLSGIFAITWLNNRRLDAGRREAAKCPLAAAR
ncbi:MAG TPA: hypothetical protein VG225_15705 [Terracidiphilus sp.]|jgi:hypothetical protein|nr:hypothetical protein [Terracidiphilus sp.]